VNTNTDQGLTAVPQLQGIGNRDNLHDARIFQSLHPAANGGFGESNLLGDRAVGSTSILLQGHDDFAVQRVEAV
jgi:hypothetical protein